MARPTQRSAVILTLLMLMVIFSNSAGAAIVPEPNTQYIDSELLEAMEINPSESYPVIIQFSN